MVVENHPDTLKWLVLYLEDLGHAVVSARSVSEATAMLAQHGCEVLISDIGLPDGDGWELLEHVRKQQPIYAIAMSGFGLNADAARSRAAGFRHHLLKPFKPATLKVMLEEAAAELAAPAAR